MSRYFTKTLAALEPYVPGEQLKIDDLVKLNANENPYPPAPGVAAAVAAVRGKPAPTAKGRMSLSSRFQKTNISICCLRIWPCRI